jgi:rhamnogalacturonan endolyase
VRNLRRRSSRRFSVLLAAASTALAASQAGATITLTKSSNTSWLIGNGDLNVTFDPTTNNLKSVAIGSSGNLLDPADSMLYPEFAGTPFGGGTQTFGSQQTANYLDVWSTTASTGTSTNPVTYSFHYVFYNNDPNVSVYEVVSHAATDPATSVGQGQFLARVNPTQFFNSYQMNVSPNNPGAQTSVIQNPNTFPTQTGRVVQDATTDLTGSGIPGDWGGNFYTKYDYSSYTQFLQANTEYGSTYSVSTIFTSLDTFNGGPTKQDLQYTNNIAMIEFLSDHYATSDPNYAYTPQQGVATTKIFGPYDFSFNTVAGQTGTQLEQVAVNSIPTLDANYNSDAELISNGYIPTTATARGSIQVNANSTAGWSSNTTNNTVVFSDPNKMFQESSSAYQYWAQLSSSGTAAISSVVPGTYRMTLYQLGQWGETRVDGVQVAAGQTTTPSTAKFIPENFSTSAPIWTIGTPDRSAHEFLNGSATAANTGVVTGGDLRQFYGNYDYWAEEQALGTPGQVVYYATAVGSTPATNNPLKWIGNQWGKFDPGIYDATNNTTDEYSKTAPAYVIAGGGPATYGGLAWDVNFTTTAAQNAQGSFVDLTVGLAANEASLVVALNGHTETWHFGGTASDPMIRSGVAGVYQMIVFQWPTTDLVAVGSQDQFTFGVSQSDGVMYDALRMEISSTGAAPNTTGWHDYAFVNSNSSSNAANADNVLPTDPSTWNLSGGGSWATSGNWSFGGVPNAPGATAYLASSPGITAASTITLGANQTLGALVFNNTVAGTSNSYSISPNGTTFGLTFDNGSAQALIDDEAGNHLIAVPVTLNSDLSASVTTSTNTLTISGAIGGVGRLLVSGAGNIMLSGNNTFTGDTAVNSGTLNLASAGHLVSSNIIVAAGATFLDAGTISTTTNLTDNGTSSFTAANPTVATLNGSGALNLNPTILTVTGGGTLSGVAAGTGGITVSGGAMKLSAANTYTGATSITGGSLELLTPVSPAVSSLATSSISVSSGATVTLDSGTTITSTPNLNDSGTATFKNTAVSIGSLNGAGTLNLTPSALTVTNGGSFSGLIAGTGPLTVSGGSLVLSHVDTYSGATTVTGGSLEIASGSIVSLSIGVSSGAALTVDSGAVISGQANLTDNGTANFKNATQSLATLNGSGALTVNPTALTITGGGTFSGAITGSGTLTVGSGTLEIASPGSIANTGVSVSSGATLNVDSGATTSSATNLTDNGTTNLANSTDGIAALNGSGTLNLNPTILTIAGGGTFSGLVAGTGGITVSGGALQLSHADTYTGATSITGGSLDLLSPGALATSSLSLSNGATLTVDSGATISSTPNFTDNGIATFNNAALSVGSLNGAGVLNLTPAALTVTNGGTFSGTIGGSGSVAVTGGALEIASPGSISGTSVSVSPGASLTIDSGATIAGGTNLTDNGTTSFASASQSIATLNGSGALNLNPTALTITAGGTFSGTIGGNGAVTISGGTLEIASPGSIANTNVSVSSGAGLTVDSGAILATGTDLSDAGTVNLKDSVQNIAVLSGAGTLNLNPTALTVTGGGTFSGPITGSGSLTTSGGTLLLSNTESYTGATTVTGGRFEIASGGSLASTAVSTTFAGATLTVDSGASLSASTTLSDAGTVTLNNSSQTIATLNGAGNLNLNPTALTVTGGGTFTGPINGTGTLTVAAGTLNLTGPLGVGIALVSNGTTNFAANTGTAGPAVLTMASLSIGAVGEVTVGSSPVHANRTVVEVGSLTFAGTPAAPAGLLDLKDNDLIVHNGTLSDITSEIATASDHGAWDGVGGITSSVAPAARNTTLAAVLNDDGTGTETALFSDFDGQSVVDSDVLVKYTFYGDADLNGQVNAADYVAIDNGFNMGLVGWQNGDFNYDGVINGDDYTLIDNAFNTQGGVSFAGVSAGPTEMVAGATEQVVAGSSSAVPEPGSLGLLGMGACLLARRRRRA